jgi:hypothetical protein
MVGADYLLCAHSVLTLEYGPSIIFLKSLFYLSTAQVLSTRALARYILSMWGKCCSTTIPLSECPCLSTPCLIYLPLPYVDSNNKQITVVTNTIATSIMRADSCLVTDPERTDPVGCDTNVLVTIIWVPLLPCPLAGRTLNAAETICYLR